LSRAAELSHERIVKLLLENSARPDFEDEPSQTPLSRAIDADFVDDHAAVIELLDSYSTSCACCACCSA
jgi:ankyrin repeat protein